MVHFIGVDMGSTSTKVAVFDPNEQLLFQHVRPTGWSSVDTASSIQQVLADQGVDVEKEPVVATGYGRIAVPYANKTVTEITCHGRGAAWLFGPGTYRVVDIGGQDTKIILLQDGLVKDFIMNDKCAAGTGRFLEIMAATMGVDLNELAELARQGSGVSISSMCTVFAESEVISLIGAGRRREDIAYGVVDSIAEKVRSQCLRLQQQGRVVLTGGLCQVPYILEALSAKLGAAVETQPLARYAGAIGAALTAKTLC